MKPGHIIGVGLDLGGGRRGVDMGPSAFRIAGLGDQIHALGRAVFDKGNLPSPMPETKRPADKRKKYIRDIAKVCQKLYDVSLKSLDDGAVPLVLGGDHSLAAGSVAASATWVQRTTSKPIGLVWVDAHGDMNTPDNHEQRQRSRHAVGSTARAGAGGARLDRVVAVSPSATHRAHGHPQSRRTGEGADSCLGRPRLYNEGHRQGWNREGRRARARARAGWHGRRAHLVRHGRLRPVVRARCGDAGQGRPRLPRSAHGWRWLPIPAG